LGSLFRSLAWQVSHDRAFMDRVCDHLLVFEGQGKARLWQGSYSELEQHQKENEQATEAEVEGGKANAAASSADGQEYLKQLKRRAGMAPRKIAAVESKLEELEAEMEAIDAKMMATGSDASEAMKLNDEKERLQNEQARLYQDWEDLEALLQEAAAAGLV